MPDDLPVLALDVDGVILNYVEGIGAHATSLGHVLGCASHELVDWELSNYLPSMTLEERMRLYVEFSTHESFSALKPYEGAVDAIIAIREEFRWLRVVAITSAGTSPETMRLRKLNLMHFPLDDISVLPMGACKREHLARLPTGSIFVDDLPKNVQVADEVGLVSVLFRHSYNAGFEHPRVISNWKTGLDLLRELLAPTHATVAAPQFA